MEKLIYGMTAPGAVGKATESKALLYNIENFICQRNLLLRMAISFFVVSTVFGLLIKIMPDFLSMPLLYCVVGLTLMMGFCPSLVFKPLHLLAQGNYKTFENVKLNKKYIKPLEFSLRLGYSSGKLAIEREHPRGLAPHQHVHIELQDAATNFMVLGGTGAGKTTSVINPILNQLMDQDTGGLIFDIKGSYKYTALKLAERNNRKIRTIGIGQTPINLLQGLSPETVSGFLVSAFYLGGKVNDGFWITAATNLCKSILYVLQQCPGDYTLKALYQFVKIPKYRKDFLKTATQNTIDLNSKEKYLLMTSIEECEAFWAVDGKLKDSVIITIEQVLNSFTHPDIAETFCSDSEDNAQLQDVLDGTIFLLDLPLSEWRKTGKTIYTFVKLRFMDIMQSREYRPDLNQDRPVFFCCDEYQDLICGTTEGLSDTDFWSKSRSSKCIGLISSQSLTAIINSCHDKTSADTILNNFRQKLFLRTEDEGTLKYMNFLGGEVEVKRTSFNQGTSSNGFTGSQNEGQATSLTMRPTVDVTLVNNLESTQVIAFLNIDRQAAVDIIWLDTDYVA